MKIVLLFLILLISAYSQSCPPHCVECSRTGQCSQCTAGFQLNELKTCGLYTPIQGCFIYSSTRMNTCVQCKSQRAQYEGKCVKKPENCATVDRLLQCQNCSSGFKLVRDQCLSNRIANCPKGSFAKAGACFPMGVENCLQQGDGYCANCRKGFENVNGVCISQVHKRTPCQNCECSGLLYNNICYEIEIKHCQQSSNGIYCDLCEKDFVQIKGVCYQPVKLDDINCNVMEDGVCTGCNQGFRLDRNRYCVKEFNVKECFQLDQFDFLNGQCFYKDLNCAVIDASTFDCRACFSGYQLINGQCDKIQKCSFFRDNVCENCFPNFYLDVRKKTCFKLSNPNCVDYNSNENRCQVCSNYTAFTDKVIGNRVCAFIDENCLRYNVEGSCVLCPVNTHFLQGRSCRLKAENCLRRKSQNEAKCVECVSPGFHLDPEDEKCYEDQEGCLFYKEGILCQECSSNYLLRNGRCLFLDQFCLQINEAGNCKRCSQGYLPYFNKCVYYDPYCIGYNNNRQCEKTFDGFFVAFQSLSQEQKQQYRNFVMSAANSQAGFGSGSASSSSSTSGFFSSRGIIQQLPYARVNGDLVEKWTFLGQVTCKSGYQQVGQNCKGNEVSRIYNCLKESNDNTCITCQEGFSLLAGKCVFKVSNCYQYNVYGLCSKCEEGYGFWGGTCQKLQCNEELQNYCNTCLSNYTYQYGLCFGISQNNCVMYNRGVCSSCRPGYYRSSGGECKRAVRNCLTTNEDTGRCFGCISGYALYKEYCVRETENCQDYDINEKCVLCVNRTNLLTQLMDDGSCPVLPFKCKILGQDKKCEECQRGYSLYPPNRCVIIRDGCLEYDQYGRCSKCQTNYVLQKSRCFLNINNCEKVQTKTKKCLECATNYYVTNDGFCARQDPNCVQVFKGTCRQCRPLYYLDDSNFCIQNPKGCSIYSFQKGCVKCLDLYILVDGKCSLRQGIFNGCKQYIDGFPECLMCEVGFTLKNNLCYANDCKGRTLDRNCRDCPTYFRPDPADPRYCSPYFCTNYTNVNSVCSQFEQFYQGGHAIRHQSIITIVYCLGYDSNGICQRCSNFRYPNTQTKFNLCYPYNCISKEEFNCKACQKGFGSNGKGEGICVADFCQEHNLDGKCRKCQQPYSLVAGGTCQNQGLCLEFDKVLMKCSKCKPYFELRGASCASTNCVTESKTELGVCQKCKNGFQLFSDGTCRLKFCEVQLTLSICRRCQVGYVRNNILGTCQPTSCLQYDKISLRCLNCHVGFFINDEGLCQTNNCADFQGIQCKKCNDNYTLTDQVCEASNCAAFNEQKVCLKCVFGYILNETSSLCQKQEDFCLQLNPITSFCSQCLPGYVLTPGKKCIKKIEGCLDHSSLGCSRCKPGYESINDRCQVKFCQQLSDNPLICLKCKTRFLLTDGLCRVAFCEFFSEHSWVCNSCLGRFQLINREFCQTKNCSILGNNGECTVCQDKYDLVDGNCLLQNCVNKNEAYCTDCIDGWKHDIAGFCSEKECNTADFLTGECTSCHHGRRLLNGVCILDNCLLRQSNGYCTTCEKQFYVSNNQLVCIAYFCIEWDESNGQCKKCAPNFQLRNGLCASTLCLKFVDDPSFSLPQCSQCLGNYYAFGQYCVPNACPSENYDPYINSCSECDFGYIFKNGSCVLDNCIKFQPNDKTFSKCLKCRVGYSIQTGLCLANNCSAYIPGTIACEGCFPGFYLFEEICLTENCLNYDDAGLCIDCLDGYQLLENKTCTRFNCLQQSIDQCLACKEGYRVTPSSSGFCQPINCQAFTPDYQKCTLCNEGLFYDNGICKDINCAEFSQWFVCQVCRTGFSFNPQTGLCQISYRGFCPERQYFDEDFKLCTEISIEFCRFILYGTPKQCIQCVEGYFLWQGLCHSFDGCKVYSYLYGCYSCIEGYSLDSRGCKNADSNCLSYNGGKCESCVEKYFLNSNAVCQKYPLNCVQVFDGVCSVCAPQYSLKENVCIAQYCNIYDPLTSVCQQCRKGYYLSDYKLCILNPENCLIASSTGVCQECVASYQLRASKCILSTKNCLNYVFETCTDCVAGYYLSLRNQCLMLPQDCTEASRSGECKSCRAGFSLVNWLCFRTISYCSIYDEKSGGCLFCQEGYYLTQKGICLPNPTNCVTALPNGKCSICESFYKLTDSGLCLYEKDEACTKYDDNNVCLSCRSLFYLNLQSVCKKNPLNCQVASSLGICTSCFTGYYLGTDSYCYERDKGGNCQDYNPTTHECSRCESYFYLSSTKLCIKNPEYCEEANYNGFCVNCLSGYHLSDGYCYIKIDYCDLYERITGKCSVCSSGYTLTNGRCTREVNYQHCISRGTGTCNRCLARYFWSQLYCSPYPVYCVNVDFSYNCLSCCYGSTLVNGVCTPNSERQQNCQKYDYQTKTCHVCQTGYDYCSVCAICLPRDPNCVSYGSQSCISCRKGFRKVNGVCVSQPTGILRYDSSFITCAQGYAQEGNHCYRNKRYLKKSSSLGEINYFTSLNSYSNNAWETNSNEENQYIGMKSSSPQIVHAIELTGAGLSSYVIQFRNSANSPFICWNSCLAVEVSKQQDVLNLDYPIIATQLRLYPVRYQNVSIKLECWIETMS